MEVDKNRKYRPNLNEIAYEEIKNMIFAGELVQGERILLDKMAERLNLSITPVREALNKLAQENLIHVTPRIRYEVVRLNKDDIIDICELRELLETFALRSAGDNLKYFPVEKMRAMIVKIYRTEDYMQFIDADILLHEAIISIAKNKKLKKLFDLIYNGIRVLAIPSAKVPGRIERSNQEHLALLKAIGEGNIERAIETLSHHIQQVKSILLDSFSEQKL